jgi:N-formylglutamate deformylase
LILHIPHNSTYIPAVCKELFIVSKVVLDREILCMTDKFTEDLFSSPQFKNIVFPYSRLLIDVERFDDDQDEPMSQFGMGMLYTKTSQGKPLKHPLNEEQEFTFQNIYHRHHLSLTSVVQEELDSTGYSLIIDCHSFPSQPLACDFEQATPRVDICIGSDPYHTSNELVEYLKFCFTNYGYSVQINHPYSGTMVPMDYYQKDRRVESVMIEINRKLYMNESSGLKTFNFDLVQLQLSGILKKVYKQFNQPAKECTV